MDKLPSIEEMAKDVAQRAMQEITINDMPLSEFIEKVNNAVENSNCNITTCRYNKGGKCTNKEKWKECVDVAKSVLCIKDVEDKNPLNICKTNENCECDPDKCSKAIDVTMFSDLPFRKFICGSDKCKYDK